MKKMKPGNMINALKLVSALSLLYCLITPLLIQGQSRILDSDELELLPVNYSTSEAALFPIPNDLNTSIGGGARSFVEWLDEGKNVTLMVETDMQQLDETRFEQKYQPALIRLKNGPVVYREEAKVRTRGHFRCRHCDLAPIKLKVAKKRMIAAGFGEWNEFKIVMPCKKGKLYEQYVLKEYLAYRLFNLITDKSFRVKRINIQLKDINRQDSYYSPAAFLVEHVEEAEDRLSGKELPNNSFDPNLFSRKDYTRLQVFQFMIGNTDWMPVTAQNLKMVQLKDGRIIPIPYDFDFSGLVHTEYAIPNPRTGVSDVRERVFMGNGKTMEEIQAVLDEFRVVQNEMISMVARFEPLDFKERKRVIRYLQSFFSLINDPQKVEKAFIAKPPFELPMY